MTPCCLYQASNLFSSAKKGSILLRRAQNKPAHWRSHQCALRKADGSRQPEGGARPEKNWDEREKRTTKDCVRGRSNLEEIIESSEVIKFQKARGKREKKEYEVQPPVRLRTFLKTRG